MHTATAAGTSDTWRRLLAIGFPLVLVGALTLNFLTRVGHDEQRSVEVLLLALTGLAACVRAARPLTGLLGTGAGRLGLLGFFVCGIASAALAYSPRYASLEIAMFVLLLTLALESGAQLRRAGMPGIVLTLQALGCACALNAVRMLVNYGGSFVLGNQLEGSDFAPGFSNIRFFNHTQTALLPLLALLVCLTPKATRARIFWFGLLSLWWMALLATAGRGTMAGLLAACIFVAVVLRRAALPYLKTLGSSALTGVLMYLVFLVLIPLLAGHEAFGAVQDALSRTASDPGSRRGFIWTNAIAIIGQHPWLGVGPMHFAHEAARFHWAAHPHDWILQIGAEWGLPAVLCLGVALFCGMRALVQPRVHARETEDGAFPVTVLAALLMACAAILVDGLVSGLIVMPQSQLAIALVLALAFAWCGKAAPDVPTQANQPVRTWAKRALLLAAVACLVRGVYPEIVNVNDNLPPNATSEAINRGIQWPRLWQGGFF